VVEHECLKSAVILFQEEAVEDSIVEVAEAPPVPKEDVPPPTANGDDHPVEELVEPVEEEIPGASVPEVCVRWFVSR